MKDQDKTKEQLVNELAEMRQRVAEVEAADTERKRVEEALREAKEFSDSLIASMKDGFSVLDSHGIHTDVNLALCQMTGLSREELIGVGPPHPYWPPEAYEEIERAFQKTLRSEFGDFELTFMRKNGERFPVIVSPSWIKDRQGNVISYFATVKDITERKRAEEALHRERDKAQRYLDIAEVILVALDKEGKITLINRRGCQVLGYEEKELIGKNWFDTCLPAPIREDVWAVFQELVAGELEPVEYYENPVLTRSGEERIIAWHNALLTDEAGRTVGTLSSGEDITERKRAEEELQQKAEDLALLNSLNEAINRGDSLQEVIQLLSRETKRIFSSHGATAYLLSEDREYLVMQNLTLPPAMVNRIEKLIGMKMPAVRIPLKAGSRYRKALQAGNPQLINDPATIQGLMAEFTENKLLKKLVPKIYRVLDIRSVINAPLVSRGEAIGLLDISRKEPFTESDLHRVEILSGRLTAIVNRKQAWEATKLAHAELDQIFQTAAGGMWVIDKDFNVLRVNETFLTLVGVSRDEALGKKCYEVFSGPLCHTPSCTLTRILGGEEHVEGEVERERTDGIRIPCVLTATPFRRPGGELMGIVEDFEDITERKRAEEELRESEERYHSLFNGVPVGIHRTMPGGQILDANPALVHMLGYPDRETLLAVNVTDLYVDPEDRRRWQALVEREGVVRGFEAQWRRRDGTTFWARSNARAVCDASGRVLHYEGSLEDITERKRAEEALELKVKQLATLSQASQAVTASLELDQVLAEIVSLAGEVVASDYTGVVLVDEAGHLGQSAETLPGVPAIEYRIRDEGLTSWIVRSRQTGVIDEIGEDGAMIPDLGEGAPRFANPLIVEAGVKSVAGLPLMVKGRLLGVLYIYSLRPGAFHGQLPLLTTLANQVAIAVENARLYEGAQRELTERKRAERLLQALNQAALAMERALTPEEIFAAAAGQFKKLNFSCTVLLTDESQKRLLPKYFSYEAGAIKTAEKLVGLKAEGFSIPVETVDVYRKVVRERETVFVENAEEVVRQLLPGPAKRLAKQIARMLKVSKSIDAPLIVEDEIIGLLLVQSDDLTEEDIPSITAFAHQMAAVWRKARLMEDLERSLIEQKRAEEELQRTLEKLREALGGIIQTVALTVETRDPYTAGHQRRVSNLARAIANEMGLSEEQIDGIRMTGLIHDLGKVGVPAEILSKPGPLDDLQYGLIQAHSQIGYDILKTVEFPWPVAQIVLQHHERLDGSGYPQGLSGEEIVLEARILAVADVVEAMASFRPYRPPRGLDKALEEISQNRGILYDPEAVDACLKLFTEKGFTFE